MSLKFPGSRFLDLYAGTGAVGIEALSRGATHVTFVESNPHALSILRENIAACHLGEHATVCAKSVRHFLRRVAPGDGSYDILFADPPYDETHELVDLLAELSDGLIAPHACLVIEHAKKTALPNELGGCIAVRRYAYGDTTLTMFSRDRPEAS